MKSKYFSPIILGVLFGLLFLPKFASANGMAFISFLVYLFGLFPIIILIELFVFWFLAKKVFKAQVTFSKILLTTVVANIPASILGAPLAFVYPDVKFFYAGINHLFTVGIIFIILVFVEWLIYMAFFKKNNIRLFSLLKISFIGNLISLILINAITGYLKWGIA